MGDQKSGSQCPANEFAAFPLSPAFYQVIVPMTSPGIVAGVLLVFIPSLGLYAVNDILGGGKVDMIGNIIENQFKGNARDWPFGAALGIVLLIGFAAAFLLTSRQSEANLSNSSSQPV